MNSRRKWFHMLGLGAVGALLAGGRKPVEQWDMSGDPEAAVTKVDGVVMVPKEKYERMEEVFEHYENKQRMKTTYSGTFQKPDGSTFEIPPPVSSESTTGEWLCTNRRDYTGRKIFISVSCEEPYIDQETGEKKWVAAFFLSERPLRKRGEGAVLGETIQKMEFHQDDGHPEGLAVARRYADVADKEHFTCLRWREWKTWRRG